MRFRFRNLPNDVEAIAKTEKYTPDQELRWRHPEQWKTEGNPVQFVEYVDGQRSSGRDVDGYPLVRVRCKDGKIRQYSSYYFV